MDAGEELLIGAEKNLRMLYHKKKNSQHDLQLAKLENWCSSYNMQAAPNVEECLSWSQSYRQPGWLYLDLSHQGFSVGNMSFLEGLTGTECVWELSGQDEQPCPITSLSFSTAVNSKLAIMLQCTHSL